MDTIAVSVPSEVVSHALRPCCRDCRAVDPPRENLTIEVRGVLPGNARYPLVATTSNDPTEHNSAQTDSSLSDSSDPAGKMATICPLGARNSIELTKNAKATLQRTSLPPSVALTRLAPRHENGGFSSSSEIFPLAFLRALQRSRDLGLRKSQRPISHPGSLRLRLLTARRSISVATKFACGQACRAISNS